MIKIANVDSFCGGGGSITGAENAMLNGEKVCSVIYGVNHDPKAIASSAANHPNAIYLIEDFRLLNLDRFNKINLYRNAGYLISFWASLECMNHSNAKGGKPKDADSRTLGLDMYRYIEFINPDFIIVENVKEFLDWGPIDNNGFPIKELKGQSFTEWLDHIKAYGYNYDQGFINAADLGAFTSRERYFGIFAKLGLPIVFPEPEYSKNGKNGLPKWKAVREKIDLTNHGTSIFDRKKPLVQKTLDRIAYGITKFVLHGETEFLLSYYGTGDNVHSLNKPLNTITTKDRFGLVKCVFTNQFLMEYYSRNDAVTSLDQPCKTITTNNRVSLDEPLGSILTNPKASLITVLHKAGIIKDIKTRMLTVHELKTITGFPENYLLAGSSTEAKKFIGNAVVPIVAQKIFETLAKAINEEKTKVA